MKIGNPQLYGIETGNSLMFESARQVESNK